MKLNFLNKPKKLPEKTREEIEKDIDNAINGNDHSQRGKMLRRTTLGLMAIYPKEKIRQMFIDEYIKKYGELKTGKITFKKLKKQSEKELGVSKNDGLD